MSSQTSLVAEQVRLQQWAAQIQDCKNRPADMKVETWCSEHGITKANYYYRLKRVRKACLEIYNPEPAFVELPQPTEKALPQEDSSLKPTAILRNSRGLALEIYNPAVIAAIINTIGFMVTFNAANAVFTAVIAPEILGTIVIIVLTLWTSTVDMESFVIPIAACTWDIELSKSAAVLREAAPIPVTAAVTGRSF